MTQLASATGHSSRRLTMTSLLSTTTSSRRRVTIKKYALLVAFPLLYFLHHFGFLWNVGETERTRSEMVGDLFKPSECAPLPLKGNLVAQNEGIVQGPWTIDPPLPKNLTTEPFTIRFKCRWHESDFCPDRYIVVLRGPTIYSPPLTAIKQSTERSVVTVEISVNEPGEYDLHAWADFESCPRYWKEHMQYPVNRGQVLGTPMRVRIEGRTQVVKDSVESCALDHDENIGSSNGRWISRAALQPAHQWSEWTRSFPDKQNYIYQPYSCKRAHISASDVLNNLQEVKNILFVGDSVIRGSFCAQIWPSLSQSGVADGNCKFIDDPEKYHVAPKDMTYMSPSGRRTGLSFRFMDDKPVQRLTTLIATMTMPSIIVANVGLWLAPLSLDDYRNVVTQFLELLSQSYPNATIIWRTTTDVAPMIQCFSDKRMTRLTMHGQRQISIEVVESLRNKGVRIFVVDAYAMTESRPDSGNDGRHWVIESPEELGWIPKGRPSVGDSESAALDAMWDIIRMEDEYRIERSRARSDES